MANLTHEEQQPANTATKRSRRRSQTVRQKLAEAKKSGVRVTLWGGRKSTAAKSAAEKALARSYLIPEPHEAAVTSPAKALAHELAGQLKPPVPKLEPGKKIGGAQLGKILSDLAIASTDVLGTSAQALAWLKDHPVPALDGQTSAELIAEGLGNAVVDYLDELRHGSRG
jgi:hypothetical protein